MRVAGVQLDIAWEDPTENLSRAAPLIREAAERGARLVALPEMFATGFSMRSEVMASHAPATREFLAQQAAANDIWLVAGYAEPGRDRPANACGLFSPSGKEVLHYRKIHPFSAAREGEHYEAGESLETFDVEGVRTTPVICYDLRFPEIFRARASATDLFVVIANWPARRGRAWRTLLAARAIDDQAWVLGVNRVGDAEGHPHSGDTTLLDPWGEVVATLVDQPGVVLGEVSVDSVTEARERFRFLGDRRPEVYRKLEES
jgi:predicted amidohydrolase